MAAEGSAVAIDDPEAMNDPTRSSVRVRSPDGTELVMTRRGHGPGVLLVHGTSVDGPRWHAVGDRLQDRFTLFCLDRRGRAGRREPPDAYTAEREFEDVAAAADAVGGPVQVVGHSYGALCAREAARRTRSIVGLVLYEPPIDDQARPAPPIAETIDGHLGRGDCEAAVLTFFREHVRMPEAALAALRDSPVWPARLAAAPTIPRELRAGAQYVFRRSTFDGLDVPVTLLLGSNTNPVLQRATELVRSALGQARIVTLAGQGHIAMDTALDLFVTTLGQALEAQSAPE